jgi:hypothetical protein
LYQFHPDGKLISVSLGGGKSLVEIDCLDLADREILATLGYCKQWS